MVDTFEWWLIEKYDDRDFLIGDDSENTLLSKKNPYQLKQEFDQSLRTEDRMSCAIFSKMAGLIWYNTGQVLTQEDVQEASTQAIQEGVVDPAVGAWFIDAINFIRRLAKEKYDKDLVQYRLPITGRKFAQWLANWWAFVLGYYSSIEMRRDSEADWIVNGTDFPKWGGHAVYYFYKDGNEYVVNSYSTKRKYNTFRIEHIDQLIKNDVMFDFVYTLVPKEIMAVDKQYQKDLADIERARNIGITNDDQVVIDMRRWNYTQKVQTILISIRTARKFAESKE